MNQNEREHTDYSILCPANLGYKKALKNLLGFFIFRHNGYSDYRRNNDGYFFISNEDLLKETGIGSKSTLQTFVTVLLGDGWIEKISGDRHTANHYRLTQKCTTKCTTVIADNEMFNKKSVPPSVPQTEKCTTNFNTKCTTKPLENTGDLNDFGQKKCTVDKEKDIEKECSYLNVIVNSNQNVIDTKRDDTSAPDWTYDGEINTDVPEWMMEIEPTEPFEQYTSICGQMDNRDNSVFYTDGLKGEETTDTFQADETETNNLIQYEDVLPTDNNTNNPFYQPTEKKTETMKQTTAPKNKSWKAEIEEGYENREQVPYEHRAEARKWYWQKWNAFISTLDERSIEDNNDWFRWFRTRLAIVTAQKYFNEQYESIKSQYQPLFNKRWWDEYNELIQAITDNPQDYLANTRRYTTKANSLKDLLKQNLKGDELLKHQLAADLKYRNATDPLLAKVKVDDPDTIGRGNSDDDLEMFRVTTETYNPSTYDAATGAYYYDSGDEI